MSSIMNAAGAAVVPGEGGPAQAVLKATGVAWFVAAAAGQAAFIVFILGFFGLRIAMGDFEGLNDKTNIDGYIPGDRRGNLVFTTHVLLASLMTAGGLTQLVPAVRRHAPSFHRWNGRLFMLVALVMSISGLWLVWGRGSYLSLISGIAITGDGILIIVLALVAWSLARAGDYDRHRRWAMRTFMVVSGVWFLRVGIMAWAILNQGPLGMNRTLSGPADIMLIFGSYLVPLGILEIYLAAIESRSVSFKLLTALLVLVATLVMSVGIFGAVAVMWLPVM